MHTAGPPEEEEPVLVLPAPGGRELPEAQAVFHPFSLPGLSLLRAPLGWPPWAGPPGLARADPPASSSAGEETSGTGWVICEFLFVPLLALVSSSRSSPTEGKEFSTGSSQADRPPQQEPGSQDRE